MIPAICSPKRTEPPVEPPALHRFGIDPGARKHCFNRSVAEEPPHEKLMRDEILDDLQTIRSVRSITTVNATELTLFQNKETITRIQKLRDMTSLALLRLQETENTQEAAFTAPESPVSLLSHEAGPAEGSDHGNHRRLRAHIQASSQGVVHGTGVVAKKQFKKGEFISLYHGPLIYRIRSRKSGQRQKFNVFKLEQGKKGPVPRFMEKDTFAAWSGIFLKYSGTPGIEIGRDAVGPIRYLNHSKNANVRVISPRVVRRLPVNECEQVLLKVNALKDIAPGEELLFDYDPDLEESEIDFTLSTVEKPGKNRAIAIHNAVRKIHQKTIAS
ncbi:SET domain-containing protein [Salinisphaera sp. G21_0]|uniref:SET domain-containing protein n=1 Tax=Salinisphaera sp. G21_0 TaxID=2821094 RepID=UPI001ADC9594|nr:SET domain-containing protein [Salinisphaera sp. G21_0]MBO9481867.1 SET domain-containing protein-lysine N-methyltransferase [Salinisphaera sp. G21_0]